MTHNDKDFEFHKPTENWLEDLEIEQDNEINAIYISPSHLSKYYRDHVWNLIYNEE